MKHINNYKTSKFIEKAKKIHINKYDYSLVEYIKSSIKVSIICYIHGIFEMKPNDHLRKCGCPSCKGVKKSTTKEFIEKSNITHNNYFDYSLVEYINNKTKVKIICPIHGIFEQIPQSHLKGKGCLECSGSKKLTNESFTTKSNIIHNNKYDYSLTHYDGNRTKVKIICPIHGIFEQIPNDHLRNHGCPECTNKKKLTNDSFIIKSNIIHNTKYDYSLTHCDGNKTKVKIICPIHGIFEQIPDSHLKGRGCPICGNINKRISHLKRIEENKLNGYQLVPNFNKTACKIFDDISIKEGIHIQHAMNGGEYHIKELGYWVDGYDKENNTVYEFDEHDHKYRIEKDIVRQNEIEYHLKCKFIRLNKNNIKYDKNK